MKTEGKVTLFLPRGGQAISSKAGVRETLPPHLQEQLPRRLRNIALLYALAYFLSDPASSFLGGELGSYFRRPIEWIPATASIVAALVVAALAASPRLSWKTKLHVGLAFQVLGSYGIAWSMYTEAERFAGTPIVFFALSPSWVAIWMIVYSVVVPAPRGRALLALLASASAQPVVIAISLERAGLSHIFTPETFFFSQVFQNLIVVVLAYAGSRIVVKLGADVSRARELGSYRLVERLGQGGMGEVWRATHQLLAREAAIKFIRPDSIAGVSATESSTMLRRFEREARATASLTSAHTVDLYDFGVSSEGTFYYVMELLDGLDLDVLVRRHGALPPARAVHLLAQVCESLEEAHERGLIHRDVKPANIYVCRSGTRHDFVKVLDFGLVTLRSPAGAADAEADADAGRDVTAEQAALRLTMTERALGTPAFMAPEVALGKPIDGRSDLYGLGCVAYWLVTGRPVFEGASALEVVSKHVQVAPEPPSRHAARDVPPELDALILACLEKAPERRPESAREVARRLIVIPLKDAWSEELAEAWWSVNAAAAPESTR